MQQSVRIPLPSEVTFVLERLRRAGFSCYAVGGCVRDALLGRAPNDWDVTTSATPSQMQDVFSDLRRIETGIRHGTLTVLVEGVPLEITTFRSDGIYLDNRHPSSVTFSSTVEEDLARRDFTVNAMAYHPEEGLIDLYGGAKDLRTRTLRCVGVAEQRFREDGLRILRALRFSSVLDFEIEKETAAAIHSCRALLTNIAWERIREEFFKLLVGRGAPRILRDYTDVLEVILPEITPSVHFLQHSKYHCDDVYEHTVRAISYAPPRLRVRLALFLHDLGKPHVKTEDAEGWHFKGHAKVSAALSRDVLNRLCVDNATKDAVIELVEQHDRPLLSTKRAVKRLMCHHEDEWIHDLLSVQRADRMSHAPGYNTPSPVLEEIPRVMREIHEEGACLSLSSLAVKGGDLMELGIPRGKRIGELLHALLEEVLEERLPNERAVLLEAAARMQATRAENDQKEIKPC